MPIDQIDNRLEHRDRDWRKYYSDNRKTFFVHWSVRVVYLFNWCRCALLGPETTASVALPN